MAALLLLASACTGDVGTVNNSDVDAGQGSDAPGPESDARVPPPENCFAAQNGIIVIEAESLPLSADWATGSDGNIGYIEWQGTQSLSSADNGRIAVTVRIPEAGAYELDWLTRVGNGNDPTEHNDSWLSASDADDFYGQKGTSRVYPKPACEDANFLAEKEQNPEVDSAACPNGSTTGGFFKVYSSGALDWRWIARTSDNDGHVIIAEYDQVGDYKLELAARSSFSQYDRIVLHKQGLDKEAVRNLALAQTTCQ